MISPKILLSFLLATWGAAVPASAATPEPLAKRIPVILDTDIGSDIDDTWALGYLLRSPELDVKLVLMQMGNTTYRATLTAKFLETVSRTEVPIGIGRRRGGQPIDKGMQSPWIEGYDLDEYKGTVHEDGTQAMIDLIMGSPEPVTIIAVGPLSGVAEALEREPRIAAKCRFVGMQGAIDVGFAGKPAPYPEYNATRDLPATRKVFDAPWIDLLLTPLNTCGTAILDGEDYHRVWSATSDPVARSIIENYCIWAPRAKWLDASYFATRSSVLFDCVAVYLAYDESLVEIEEVSFDMNEKGHMLRSPDGAYQARMAMHWRDFAAYNRDLAERLTNGK